MKLLRGLLVLSMTGWCAAAAVNGLIQNGGFEQGWTGWDALWTRTPGAGQAALDDARHGLAAPAARITHTGGQDWSLSQDRRLDVTPGEILELSAWIRVQGPGSATLGVITRDAAGQTLDWAHGGQTVRETATGRLVRARFIVPPGTATAQVRVIGHGPATVWVDDVELTRHGTLDALRRAGLPPELALSNALLRVALRTADAGLAVRDLRSGREWTQRADGSPLLVVEARTNGAAGLALQLLDPSSMQTFSADVQLDHARPECVVTLRGEGSLESPLAWPAPFASAAGQLLIVPLNEGISYPVDDASLPPMFYHLYGGHGLCMPWYGAVADEAGWMAIVETADDAGVRLPRRGGLLCLAPEWQAQRGQFGPARVIRYAFFDQGGYVAMAKRYRAYAQQTGLFRSLADKRKAVPAVDQLVGAVNVWCWEKDAPALCRELQAAGIDRILWSNARPPDELKALNELGVLTSRYDIYQDAMNPAEFPKLRWIHGDWTSDAWTNDDLMIGADGQWVRGWEVEAKEGPMIPCGTLCDRQAVAYAQRRIPAELATHPYRSRFLDTTTASPWRECYHPKHPMTRTGSKRAKMDLLGYVSGTCGLVCGSETGHDAAVPFVHYFEGMMSLGPYRVPDAGRDMRRIWDEVPARVATFQTGPRYRLPLWELVYHDCVVAQWYWGDYSNKLPALWDRRDQWNALYGTPPMFMFDRKLWAAQRDRFVRSYRATAPIARATGYSEMLSHEWLSADHSRQRTRFANGTTVTVDFGAGTTEVTHGAPAAWVR